MTIEQFAESIRELDEYTSGLVGSEDLEEIGEALIAVAEFKRRLSDIYKSLDHTCVQALGGRREVEVGDRVLERMPGGKRKKWDTPGLKELVLLRLTDLNLNEETGEVELTPGQAVDAVLDCAAVQYWRVKKLKEFGINADMFSETEEGDETIAIRKKKL